MPRRAQISLDTIGLLAPRQVVSQRELIELGMSRRTISDRCRRGGPWTRLLPGVLLLSTGTPTWEQNVDAALRYAGRDAVLTGAAVAQLCGMRRTMDHDLVHLLVPEQQQRATHAHVIVERTNRMPRPIIRSGFPTAPITRAVLDYVRRIDKIDAVRAILAELVQRKMATVAALRAELDAGSSRGSALPRMVLQELADGVWSPAESWARKLVLHTNLPAPRWNAGVYSESGEFLGIPDAWFDEVALAWEIDSYDFHLSPESYVRTLAKHSRFTAAGIIVVHTLPSRLRSEPLVVRAELEASYEQAARRSRPPVLVRERENRAS